MTYNTPELLLVGAARNLVLTQHQEKFRSGEAYLIDDSDLVMPYSFTVLEDNW